MTVLEISVFIAKEFITFLSYLFISKIFMNYRIKSNRNFIPLVLSFIILSFISRDYFTLVCMGLMYKTLFFIYIIKCTLVRAVITFLNCLIIQSFLLMSIESFTHFKIMTDNTIYSIFLQLIILAILIIFFLISKQVYKKKQDINTISYFSFIGLSINLSFIITLLLMIKFHHNETNKLFIIFFFIFCAFIIISNIFVFLYHSLKDKENIDFKSEIRSKKQVLSTQKSYIEKLMYYSDDIKKCRHDIDSKIQAITYLISEGEYEKLHKFIQSLYKDIPSKMINCSDTYIAATISQFLTKIDEEKIIFQFIDHSVSTLIMDCMEICSLFYNLMANAIEAVRNNKKEKQITLRVRNHKNTFIIEMVNSVNQDFSIDFVEHNISTKDDHTMHGYGLLNIKSIVAKHHGHIKFKHTCNRLNISIILLNVI